tara:strand:- start:463 stop:1068 length:606 start_codon:yes stop_codon:yes gene_type:complete
MNFFFVIFIPILIFILNEYYQNKIFLCFEKFYRYSKIIALFIPFILAYCNPDLVKKILVFFKDIDKKPVHQNMDDMMNAYFEVKKNNKINLNPNTYLANKNQFVNNNGYYNNVPDKPKRQFIHNNNVPKKVKRNVSESKKKYIASNQKWRCAHCNNLLDNTYEVDHIIALYKGGNNDLSNLEALCRNCHGVKTFKEKMNIA